MDNIWAVVLAVLMLVVGAFGSYTLFPQEVEVEVEVPSEPVIKYVTNQTLVEVPVEVPNAEVYLNQAEFDLFDELGDEEDFLTCDGEEYDENEVSISNVREWSYSWIDTDEYHVTVEGKFKFKTDDERACYSERTYELIYEEGEDVEVNLV